MSEDYPDYSFSAMVRTLLATNLIIDKLTTTAYTENRSTLSNNGTTPLTSNVTAAAREGKFFVRGCQGFIESIDVYCKDAGAAGGTITVYISPHPTMGYIASAVVTIPAGGAWAWRSATFNRMWLFDKLFIFVVCSTADTKYAYDADSDWDGYSSSDSGATWTVGLWRFWFRAVFKGQTVGDIPIAGTVNTIEIPAIGSELTEAGVSVPNATETQVLSKAGAGTLLKAKLFFLTTTAPSDTVFYKLNVYADGVLAYSVSNRDLTQSETATSGRSSEGEFYQLAVTAESRLTLRVPVKFKRQLVLKAYHTKGAAVVTIGECSVNLIT